MKKGFTLIETLVAIAILMVAIAGPLDIANKGLIAADNSRDQTIASYLAQDVMEYVKNVRDYNIRHNAAWTLDFSQCTISDPCTADTEPPDGVFDAPNTILNDPDCTFSGTPVVLPSSCELRIDSKDGFYTYLVTSANGVNQLTPFYRSFYITEPVAGSDMALITVSVYWTSGTLLNKVILQSVIFNTHR